MWKKSESSALVWSWSREQINNKKSMRNIKLEIVKSSVVGQLVVHAWVEFGLGRCS